MVAKPPRAFARSAELKFLESEDKRRFKMAKKKYVFTAARRAALKKAQAAARKKRKK